MGSGLSRSHWFSSSSVVGVGSTDLQQSAAARVIAADGSLREFFPACSSSPISVRDVLGSGNAEGRYFLCSSDALYFGEAAPALGAGELLRQGQVYFVLPAAMLGRPLSSADMAALALRASRVLLAAAEACRARRARGCGGRKVRVMPVSAETGRAGYADDADAKVNEKLNERTLGEWATTWASPATNAKTKMAVGAARPSLKRLLTTIQEDASDKSAMETSIDKQ